MPDERIRELVLETIENEGGAASAPKVFDHLAAHRVPEREVRTAIWSLLEEGVLELGKRLQLTRVKEAAVA